MSSSKLTKILALAGLLSANVQAADLNEYIPVQDREDRYETTVSSSEVEMHTELHNFTEFYGRGSKEVDFHKVLDSIGSTDKLLRALLPGNLGDIYPERLQQYLFADINEIKLNLLNLQNDPSISDLINYPYKDIPFDKFIEAIENKDITSAKIYGNKIASTLKYLKEEVKDADILHKLEDAVKIESRTLAELNRIKPFLLDKNVWDKDGWERNLDARVSNSTHSSMHFKDKNGNNTTIEQAKVLNGDIQGGGGIIYNFDDLLNLNLLGKIDLCAFYDLNWEWNEIDATQVKVNNFGIGTSEKYYEKGHKKKLYGLEASLFSGIEKTKEKIDLEESGKSYLTHVVYDKKGKLNLFINLGREEITSTVKDDVKDTSTTETNLENYTRFFASKSFDTFTPFISLKEDKNNTGVFINSKYLTAKADTDKNLELYVKLNTKDGNKVLEYMEEVEKLKHSLYAGSKNKIEKLKEKMNRDIGGIMLKYAENLNEKEYSVLLGKGKLALEVGQTIDDWVQTNFATLSINGVNLSAKSGKDIKSGLETRSYSVTLPTLRSKNLGTMFLDFEYDLTDKERPAVNYKISFTKRF